MERNTPERKYTDDELIAAEINTSIEMEEAISPAAARMIASQFHGGQASDLYSFASTGYISETLRDDINRTYAEFQDQPQEQEKIGALSVYVALRWAAGDRDAKEGWSELWLEQPDEGDSLCPCCFEHISKNHRVGCPLGVDDEAQLSRVIELGQAHGPSVLAYLNYRGFRTMQELEDVVQDYHSAYYGTFADLDTFRRHYDIGPAEYIDQQYEIVEGLHGDVMIFDR
mgnify:CR=1 FL=1